MALLPCSECGKEISHKTPACPQCGAPRSDALKPPYVHKQSESPKGSSAAVVGKVLLHAGLLFVLWRVAQPYLQTLNVVPAPRWFFETAGGDDSCTRLGDYCMRTKCLVRNVGDAAGVVHVDSAIILDETGRSAATKTTVLRLDPGQSQTVTFS